MICAERPPYGANLATLRPGDFQNARNLGGDRETIDTRRLVVLEPDGFRARPDALLLRTVADARWYMGRSRAASVVYCSLWVHGADGHQWRSGYGSAGGYGYHKASAALEAAMDSAGITLAHGIGGAGDSAMDHALHAIADAVGYRRRKRAIV